MTGTYEEQRLTHLPWDGPLEDWPEDLVVALPRGISRHIVRFVRIDGVVYAIKEVEEHFATRYDALWQEVTAPVITSRQDQYAVESRVRRLNDLGFDVAELQVSTEPDGEHIVVAPKVVDAGHHSRRLIRLTGLDAEENQARRLLNDLDTFRLEIGLRSEDEEIAAHRWVTERFERVMREVSPSDDTASLWIVLPTPSES